MPPKKTKNFIVDDVKRIVGIAQFVEIANAEWTGREQVQNNNNELQKGH